MHSPLLILAGLLIVFLAGVVRGFAGFGFSALCVAGLTLFLPPAQVVPPIFVLEVLASITLLREGLRNADWHWLGWLALGNALLIPVGLLMLAYLPETPLRLLIGSLLLLSAGLMRSGRAFALNPTRGFRLMTGMASGLINGLCAMGGTVVVLLLSTTQMAPRTLRATLVMLFLLGDLYALGWAGLLSVGDASAAPLIGPDTLVWTAAMTPAMLSGMWVGQRAFSGVSPERFRQQVLNLLLLIGLITVLRAVLTLLG